jgi:hypothetical protein
MLLLMVQVVDDMEKEKGTKLTFIPAIGLRIWALLMLMMVQVVDDIFKKNKEMILR